MVASPVRTKVSLPCTTLSCIGSGSISRHTAQTTPLVAEFTRLPAPFLSRLRATPIHKRMELPRINRIRNPRSPSIPLHVALEFDPTQSRNTQLVSPSPGRRTGAKIPLSCPFSEIVLFYTITQSLRVPRQFIRLLALINTLLLLLTLIRN